MGETLSQIFSSWWVSVVVVSLVLSVIGNLLTHQIIKWLARRSVVVREKSALLSAKRQSVLEWLRADPHRQFLFACRGQVFYGRASLAGISAVILFIFTSFYGFTGPAVEILRITLWLVFSCLVTISLAAAKIGRSAYRAIEQANEAEHDVHEVI